MSGEHVGRLDRLGVISVHACGSGDEVEVMAVVHRGIESLRAAALDVDAVGSRGILVGFYRLLIITGADIDMRRHVDNVSCRRSQSRQPVCASQGALRIR